MTLSESKPGQIEHVNLTVTDNARSAALFTKLLGWHERWQGASQKGGHSIHIGSDQTYLALWSGGKDHSGQRKGRPMNHIGFVVDDLARAETIVREAGLSPFGHDDYEPGRRFYFFDWDGIEFELVSY